MTSLTEIAAVLKTTEKNAVARLANLKLSPVCNRCGGSGNYSFNSQDGSRCYGCGGFGHVAPKAADLPAMFEAATGAANDGRLEEYLRYLDARQIVKTATDKVMAAWTATKIAPAYSANWRNADKPEMAAITAANKIMVAAFNGVSNAVDKLNPKSPSYRADVAAIPAMVAAAVETIKAADVDPAADDFANVEAHDRWQERGQ